MSTYHFECKTEECLLFNFGIQQHQIEHHSGRGAVCEYLSLNKNLIGLIDEDPLAKHHPYFNSLKAINTVKAKFNVKHLVDRRKNNQIIILQPKFEDWIISAAAKSKISMSDFNLSSDPNILHRDILFKIGDLQRLIHHLKRVENPHILYLQQLLTDEG